MSSVETVVANFAARKANPKREGRIRWDGSVGRSGRVNVFCDNNVLYSWGGHFPLAVHVGTDRKGRNVFIKNGDRRSLSTSHHQREVQRRCYGPTVSHSALRAAGIDMTRLTLGGSSTGPVILCWRKDWTKGLYRNETGQFFVRSGDGVDTRIEMTPYTPPKLGMWVPHQWQGDEGYESGFWHILGATVIEQDGKCFLCSLDEGSYFVSQLPDRPRSIDHALKMLTPEAVRKAERQGRSVVRQGEWFFIRTGLDDKGLAEQQGITVTQIRRAAKQGALDRQTDSSNRHVAMLYRNGSVYAKGRVYHREPHSNRLTKQHFTLVLGDRWYEVHHNTEIRSWSQGGKFD
jgi:hypothetical protein